MIIFDYRKIHPKLMHNERGIELALASDFIHQFNGDIVEVGAVTPYYLGNTNHPVVDPYDPWEGCIKQDGEIYDFTGKNVLCISTVEHFGTADYGNKDIDAEKPKRFLEKLHKEAVSYLITWPIASNRELDLYINNNIDQYKPVIYRRIEQQPPIWEYIQGSTLRLINSIKYNDPFPNGNAIYVLHKDFPVL